MLMADFPRTLVEFERMFGTEEQCRAYLERQKWPDGFRCPKCGGTTAWVLKCRLLWVCTACQHQVSLTAGTACHKTRKPLKAWFWTIYLMTSSKRGLSAKELQRHLGCSYKMAWTWLMKLRAAMVNPDREPLQGKVEMDECYIGGTEEGVSGRETEKKTVVICAADEKR